MSRLSAAIGPGVEVLQGIDQRAKQPFACTKIPMGQEGEVEEIGAHQFHCGNESEQC